MTLIKRLCEWIDDELEDAEKYARAALELKDSQPELSRAVYSISQQEMEHMNILHGQVVNLINDYKKTKGEPPAAMLAVYDYIHKKQIDEAAEVKNLQAMYQR